MPSLLRAANVLTTGQKPVVCHSAMQPACVQDVMPPAAATSHVVAVVVQHFVSSGRGQPNQQCLGHLLVRQLAHLHLQVFSCTLSVHIGAQCLTVGQLDTSIVAAYAVGSCS
jgi:hypothetical protein